MRRRRATTKGRLTATYDLEQIRTLHQLADQYGVPVSEILREALARLVGDRVLLPALMHTLRTRIHGSENAEEARP